MESGLFALGSLKEKKKKIAAGIPWRVDELAQERNSSRCCRVWQENKILSK